MMTNIQYEFMTNLQYENRDLKRQLKEFKSGEKYLLMKTAHKKQLEAEYARNRKLEIALAQANNRTAAVHRNYLQVIEDMEKEHAKGMRAKDNRIEELYERSLRGEHRFQLWTKSSGMQLAPATVFKGKHRKRTELNLECTDTRAYARNDTLQKRAGR